MTGKGEFAGQFITLGLQRKFVDPLRAAIATGHGPGPGAGGVSFLVFRLRGDSEQQSGSKDGA